MDLWTIAFMTLLAAALIAGGILVVVAAIEIYDRRKDWTDE